MPCADMEVNSATHTQTEFTSNHEKHSHDRENDLCSPFCICSCCAGYVIDFSSPVTFQTIIIPELIRKQKIVYKSIFSSNFYGSIWQPPQIA